MKTNAVCSGLRAAFSRFLRWYRQGPGRLGPEPYLPLKYRLLSCIPVAVLIVVIGKKRSLLWHVFVSHPGALLLSFVYSFIIAALLVAFAHRGNRWLDARIDWNARFRERLAWQVLLPMLGAWAMGILLAAALFALTGTGIAASGYFRFEVWIVLFLLITMNSAYAFWYKHRHPPVPGSGITHLHVTDKDGRRISIPVLRIGYIAAHEGGAVIHTTGGKKYGTKERVNYLSKKLSGNRFLMLKRKFLINISIIKSIEQVKDIRAAKNGHDTEVVYQHVLVFGNSNIKERREPLVKGTLKQVREWLKHNAHLR